MVNGNEQERLIDLSEASHWFEGVKKLRNLLSGKEITFYNEIDLKFAGMQAGIFKLKKSF